MDPNTDIIEMNRRLEKEAREERDKTGGIVRLGASSGGVSLDDVPDPQGAASQPVIIDQGGETGTADTYMRSDTIPGLMLVGTPDDGVASTYPSLEFTGPDGGLQVRCAEPYVGGDVAPTLEIVESNDPDAGSRSGIQVKIKADTGLERTADGLAGKVGTTAAIGMTPALSGKASQYLGGDGQWYNIPLAGTWWLSDTASDISGYKVADPTKPTGSEATAAATITGTDTLIEEWAATAEATPDTLRTGVMHVHIHAAKTDGTKTAQIRAKFYHRTSGGTETLIGTSDYSANLTGSNAAYDLSISVADTDFAATDRGVCKIYATPGGGGTDPQVTLYFAGTNDSRIESASGIGGLPDGAAGDILYHNGTTWTVLNKDAGKYLQSGSSAVAWASAPAATLTNGADTYGGSHITYSGAGESHDLFTVSLAAGTYLFFASALVYGTGAWGIGISGGTVVGGLGEENWGSLAERTLKTMARVTLTGTTNVVVTVTCNNASGGEVRDGQGSDYQYIKIA